MSIERLESGGRSAPRSPEERQVEADVVAHHDGVAEELEEGGEDLGDPWCVDQHGRGDAGQDRDGRRDPAPRVDERLEGAEALAAP